MSIPGIPEHTLNNFRDYPSVFCETIFYLNSKPLVLYPYQVECLNDKERFQAWFRARQTGKSTDLTLKGLSRTMCNDDENVPIISPRQRFSNRIIRNSKKFIKRSPYYDTVLWKMTYEGDSDLSWSRTEIGFTNGSLLIALPEGDEGTASVGESSTLVMVDEVAKMKDGAGLINSVVRPSLFATGGDLILASSSWGKFGKGAAWYDILKSESYKIHEVNAYQALEQQLTVIKEDEYKRKIEDLEREKLINPAMFAMQYMNSFEGGLDSPFSEDAIDRSFTNTPYTIDTNTSLIVFSVDWGKSSITGDKSVVAIMDIGDLNHLRVIKYYTYGLQFITVVEKIKELASFWKPKRILCDIGSGEAQLELLTKNLKIPVIGMKAGRVNQDSIWEDHGIKRRVFDKNTAVMALGTYMEMGAISIHCSDYNIKKEFYDYSMEITPAGNIRYDHLPGGHDDHIDPILQVMAIVKFKNKNNSGRAKHYDYIEDRYSVIASLKENLGIVKSRD